MLKELPGEFIGQAADFCWERCKEAGTRSYPLFANKAEIEEEFRLRSGETNALLLGYYSGGELAGVFCFFTIPAERYLQTTALYAEKACYTEAVNTFLCYLAAQYPAYTAYIGVPAENENAVNELKRNGYVLEDACCDLRCGISDSMAQWAEGGVLRVTEEQFDEYAAFHDAHFPDIYWNAERLRSAQRDWRIFARRDGGQIGAGVFLRIYDDLAEIFGLCIQDRESGTKLLRHALGAVRAENTAVKTIVFLTDESDETALAAAQECGFRCAGHYRLWCRALPQYNAVDGSGKLQRRRRERQEKIKKTPLFSDASARGV